MIELVMFSIDNTLVERGRQSCLDMVLDMAVRVALGNKLDSELLLKQVDEVSQKLWSASPYVTLFETTGVGRFDALCHLFEQEYPNSSAVQEWATYYRITVWDKALDSMGVYSDEMGEEIAVELLSLGYDHYEVYDDVPDTLELLVRKGIRLATVSNGESSLQLEKMTRTDLEKYFERIVISDDVGYQKPDRRMFITVLEVCDVKPQHAMIAGDSLVQDISPAQALGMKSVWVNRRNHINSTSITPDFEIQTLRDLYRIVEDLSL